MVGYAYLGGRGVISILKVTQLLNGKTDLSCTLYLDCLQVCSVEDKKKILVFCVVLWHNKCCSVSELNISGCLVAKTRNPSENVWTEQVGALTFRRVLQCGGISRVRRTSGLITFCCWLHCRVRCIYCFGKVEFSLLGRQCSWAACRAPGV